LVRVASEDLVAHDPEAPRETEDPTAMAESHVEREPREAVVRAGEVDEPFADDPVDVRNRRRPAIRALLGVVDADDVVGTRAAEVLRPRLVVRRDARVDHEARAADRELVAEYVVVAVRRALAVEQQDIAGLAGKDVEAALPEGARLGTLAPPW